MSLWLALFVSLSFASVDRANLKFGPGFSAPLVEGVAGYPITRDHVVFIANERIYLVKRESLAPEQNASFQNIGMPVFISLTPNSIEYSWPIGSLERNENFIEKEKSPEIDSFKVRQSMIQMKV